MNPIQQELQTNLQQWNAELEAAEEMIPILGFMYRKRCSVMTLCSHTLHNISTLQIIQRHQFASKYLQIDVKVFDTLKVLKKIKEMDDIAGVKIDLAKLVYLERKMGDDEVKSFYEEMRKELDGEKIVENPVDVVLYGFGRIGRIMARLLIEKTGGGDKLRLRAIVVRRKGVAHELVKRASLFKRDSVHGKFPGVVKLLEEKSQLWINGSIVQIIFANHPEDVDYTEYDIHNALLIDNTGAWTDREGLSKHLKAKGISKVVVTAPAKNVPNVVFGINNHLLTKEEKLYSTASCTTNAVVPVLYHVHAKFGILHCHAETVHSYTSGQNLLDGMHKYARRGRSAAMNLVLSSTGVTIAVEKVLPELKGKITGSSIRVPLPDVSLCVLVITLSTPTTKEAINNYLHTMSLSSHQLGYINSREVVSADVVGDRNAGTVDGQNTIVAGDKATLYVWYDNEFSFSANALRLVQAVSLLGTKKTGWPEIPRKFEFELTERSDQPEI